MEIKFNEIESRNELSDYLKIKRKTLTNVLYHKQINNCYHQFTIPKKSNGLRTIYAPNRLLKIIQKKLSKQLYAYRDYICKENKINLNISHAFERKKGIITNASIHKNKRYIINIDLKDFFDSFHFGRVKGYFLKNKYFKLPLEVSTVLAQLTCFNGKLPQGAPTSPIITNLICNVMDYKLLSLSKKYHLDYTRYADDLTFSTNDKNIIDKYEEFYNSLNKIVLKNGFEINTKKTKIVYRDSRQTITGLIVNKKINVDRRYYKKVRAMAHNLYTTGKFYIDGEEGTIAQLEGKFSFINEIERYNNRINGLTQKKFFKLSAKEKELQKFLFFKYFYANEKPIIVTEGKTDILYLKSALKNLYNEYPNLIERNSTGEFKYKVSFFKRSNRIRFFLNMSQDGADAIKNLYQFFTENNNDVYPNYLTYFNQLSKSHPKQPVILIFDNEISSGKRPLHEFLNFCRLKDLSFNDGGSQKLIEDGNLYLATHQLVNNQKESEIEDLFDKAVLKHKIDNKTFSRNSVFDTKEHYGKDHFSKYIFTNYKNIDFSNFKPLLNEINKIVTNYS